MRRVLLSSLCILFGCSSAEGPAPKAQQERAAGLGKADGGGDQADHDCQVVLRSVSRQFVGDDWETDCDAQECAYVWRGAIETTTLPEGASVHVLYHLESDPTWWAVDAEPDPPGAPGFERFSFEISEHLFGPDDADPEAFTVELVPFVRLADESRVFDHNLFSDDFDNHRLTADTGFASYGGNVCQPIVGNLAFFDNWDEYADGARRQGGYLQVHYDLDRLPQCRGTHNGFPAWDIVAHARFSPGGQEVSGSVVDFVSDMGTPTNEAVEAPLVIQIPDDADDVELWFENYSGAGNNCEAWDSNYGANYRYDIWPGQDDPRCLDIERESGIHTESDLMVHMEPYCLGYDIDAQYTASHCEFHVAGFGDGYLGHYGIPFEWVVAHLRVGDVEGDVLEAGMWTQFTDDHTGQTDQRFTLGQEIEPGLWQTGISDLETSFYDSGLDRTIEAYAFFIDVRRPGGTVVRLWHSHGGSNYDLDDAFGLPTTQQYISYGNVQWANDQASVLESRRACP